MEFEILGVFVNTLTADDKYHGRDCENLAFLIQTQLSEKQKTLSHFFVRFLEVLANFKDFEKNMIVIANVLLILQTVKELVRLLFEKRCFRSSFDSQQVRGSQTLVKSA